MDDARAGSFERPEDLAELLSRVENLQIRMKKLVDMASNFQSYASEFIDPFAEEYNEFPADVFVETDIDDAALDLDVDASSFADDWEAASYSSPETPEADEIAVRHVSHYRNLPSKLQTGYAPEDVTSDEAIPDPVLEALEVEVYPAELAPEALEPAEWMNGLQTAYRAVQNFARELRIIQAQEYVPLTEQLSQAPLQGASSEWIYRGEVIEVSCEAVAAFGGEIAVQHEQSETSEMAAMAVSADVSTDNGPSETGVSQASVAPVDVSQPEFPSTSVSSASVSVESTAAAIDTPAAAAPVEVGSTGISDTESVENVEAEGTVSPEAEVEPMHSTEESSSQSSADQPRVEALSVKEVTAEEAPTDGSSLAVGLAETPTRAETLTQVQAPSQVQEKETEEQTNEQETKEFGVIHWNRFPPPLSRRHRG